MYIYTLSIIHRLPSGHLARVPQHDPTDLQLQTSRDGARESDVVDSIQYRIYEVITIPCTCFTGINGQTVHFYVSPRRLAVINSGQK